MKNELSDNSDEWPISPFELLGVPITAEKSEIRRAYSALIRRFRPETHPKQFQSGFSAYGKISDILRWHLLPKQ